MRWLICYTLLACALTSIGCSRSTSVPESVVSNSLTWLEELKSQVAASDFANAINTVKKIDERGTIDATQMVEYLTYKARAQMGAGQLVEARATISELERGVEGPALVHVLLGEVALKAGDRTTAQTEFAKARQADSSIVVPRM